MPDIIPGRTEVKIERSEEPVISLAVLAGKSPSELMQYNLDLFPRATRTINEVDADSMDCSAGGRQIYMLSMDEYIDPCINGYTFPYAREPNRPTDLCGY